MPAATARTNGTYLEPLSLAYRGRPLSTRCEWCTLLYRLQCCPPPRLLTPFPHAIAPGDIVRPAHAEAEQPAGCSQELPGFYGYHPCAWPSPPPTSDEEDEEDDGAERGRKWKGSLTSREDFLFRQTRFDVFEDEDLCRGKRRKPKKEPGDYRSVDALSRCAGP